MDTHDDNAWLRRSRPALERLSRQIATPAGIIPIAGGGISVELGFPSWSGFLLQQAAAFGIDRVQSLVHAGQYEDAAYELQAAIGGRSFSQAVELAFGQPVRHLDSTSAAALLSQICSGPVLTTNYDTGLEQAFAFMGKPFETVTFGSVFDLVRQAIHQHRRVLVKIHGDVDRRLDRVLTKEDYEQNYGSKPLVQTMRLALTRPSLFVGLSLRADYIVTCIRDFVRTQPGISEMYAILETPDSEEALSTRKRQLDELEVTPIWYPSRDHGKVSTILSMLKETSGKYSDQAARGREEARDAKAASPAVRQTTAGGPGVRHPTNPTGSGGVTAGTEARRVKVFLSYAHRDEKFRNELDKQLASLKRNQLIEVWHDRMMPAGSAVDQAIADQLDLADLILLLITPDFLASDYCYSREMTRALERHERGDACIVPIILRPSDWQDTPIGKLLALPTDGKAVTRWTNRDMAFLDITKGIRRIVQTMTE